MFAKNEILNEIKRTAKENNGKPLGQRAFKSATRMGQYEWGRYWPTWGKALQEAGFTPNKPWTRVSDKSLVKKMVVKIRKFGKYPSLSELRIEGGKDPKFPYTIIKKRGQDFIVGKITEYCSNKTGYDDILRACEPIIEKFNEKEKFYNTKIIDKVGEVYLLKSGTHYKIGKTYDAVRRGNEIRIQMPETTNLIYSIKTDDPSGVELYWHKRFETKRKQGEWFNLDSKDVMAFKRWKKIY